MVPYVPILHRDGKGNTPICEKVDELEKNASVIHDGKLMYFALKNQDEIYVMFCYGKNKKQ